MLNVLNIVQVLKCVKITHYSKLSKFTHFTGMWITRPKMWITLWRIRSSQKENAQKLRILCQNLRILALQPVQIQQLPGHNNLIRIYKERILVAYKHNARAF